MTTIMARAAAPTTVVAAQAMVAAPATVAAAPAMDAAAPATEAAPAIVAAPAMEAVPAAAATLEVAAVAAAPEVAPQDLAIAVATAADAITDRGGAELFNIHNRHTHNKIITTDLLQISNNQIFQP